MEDSLQSVPYCSPASLRFHRPASIPKESSASRNVYNRDENVEQPLSVVLALTPTTAPFDAHSTASLTMPKLCTFGSRTDGEQTFDQWLSYKMWVCDERSRLWVTRSVN